MQSKGWTILQHRHEVAHVELDFLARDPSGLLHIVEVKSKGSRDYDYISWRQQRRLFTAAEHLSAREPVQILLLVVTAQRVLAIPVN